VYVKIAVSILVVLSAFLLLDPVLFIGMLPVFWSVPVAIAGAFLLAGVVFESLKRIWRKEIECFVSYWESR
jgi:hypothetical protein